MELTKTQKKRALREAELKAKHEKANPKKKKPSKSKSPIYKGKKEIKEE